MKIKPHSICVVMSSHGNSVNSLTKLQMLFKIENVN